MRMNVVSKALLVLVFFMQSPEVGATRDPHGDEMPAIQEIAYYLQLNAAGVLAMVAEQGTSRPELKKLIPILEKLQVETRRPAKAKGLVRICQRSRRGPR